MSDSNWEKPYCDVPLPKNLEQREVLRHIRDDAFKIIRDKEGRYNYDWTKGKVFDNGCTLLSCAIREGKNRYISAIIKYCGGLNQRESKGGTPLTIATYLNHIVIVKSLLYDGVEIDTVDVNGYSALSIAVRKAHLDIFNCLLDHDANTKLIKAESLRFSSGATNENKIKILDTLLKKGLNAYIPNAYFLVAAARIGHSDTIQKVLNLRVNVNDLFDGKTPLAWAAEGGHLEVVKILITNGAEINKLCSDGNTPLATAAKHKHLNVVKYLSGMSNISKVGPNGKTALQWAVHNEDFDMVKSLFTEGADCLVDDVILDVIEQKNVKMVQVFVEAGAIINRKNKISGDNSVMTPLKKSLQVGSIEIARYLLENGAKFEDDLDENEISFVVKFLECNNFDMIQFLIEKGARLNLSGSCGHTALTKSIKIGNFAMFKCFVEHGAHVNQIDENGLSPIAAAASNDDMRVFKFLIDRGATIGDKEMANPKVSKYYQLVQERNLNKATQLTTSAATVGDIEEPDQKVSIKKPLETNFSVSDSIQEATNNGSE